MKAQISIPSLLLAAFFLLFTGPTSYAAHAANDHVLINLVITPKKTGKKKKNWKEKIGLTFLQKRIQKRIDKLRAKALGPDHIQTRKDGELPTDPMAFLSAGLIPLTILLVFLLSHFSVWLGALVGILTSAGALVTGIMSIRRTKKYPEKYHYNNGWAIFGIILGGLFFLAAIFLFYAQNGFIY